MKTIFVFVVSLFLCSTAFAETVNAPIKNVTMFQSTARVLRSAKVLLDKGVNNIVFPLSAFRVDSSGIKARFSANGIIKNIRLKEHFPVEAPQKKVNALKSEIKGLKEILEDKDKELALVAKREQFLDSFAVDNSSAFSKEAFDLPDAGKIDSALNYFEKKYEKMIDDAQKVKKEIRQLKEQISVREKELAQITSGKSEKGYVVEVSFESASVQESLVDVSYRVQDVYWTPVYSGYFYPDKEKVKMHFFAEVYQNTGEDWQDVNVIITDKDEYYDPVVPKPDSWMLDISRPEPRGGRIMMKAAAYGNMVADTMSARMEEEREVAFDYAQKKTSLTAYEYDLGKVSINSGMDKSRYALEEYDLDCEYRYEYHADKSSNVQFVAEISGASELMAGKISVFALGEYVGESYIKGNKAGENFKISLGSDKRLKVNEQVIRDEINETSMFSRSDSKNVVRNVELISVFENTGDKSAEIMVFACVPVSRTDKIDINDVKLDPQPTESDYNDKKGVMLWRLTVPAGSERQIKRSFELTYPNKQHIRGLRWENVF